MAATLGATIQWTGGMVFQGTSESGWPVPLDSSPDLWGQGRGVQPMELILMALAGCTGMSVISILERGHERISAYQVRVRGERRETHPKIFELIQIEHQFRGYRVSPSAVERAVGLARSRYCAVAAMLGEIADIKETWHIVEDEERSDQ